MEPMNKARGFAYIYGVLRSQEGDVFCHSCSAFANTLTAVRQGLSEFEAAHAAELQNMPAEFSKRFDDTKKGVTGMKQPENPQGQKKAGNCRLPEGVCFVKKSLAVLQSL